MDLSSLLSSALNVIPFPWSLLVALALPIVLARLGVKVPFLPQPAPAPAPKTRQLPLAKEIDDQAEEIDDQAEALGGHLVAIMRRVAARKYPRMAAAEAINRFLIEECQLAYWELERAEREPKTTGAATAAGSSRGATHP